ncbi:DNA-binding protein [Luteimonas sp. MJ293]|uniref:DNA-binding protein n=1 Tax=Luteimonas sp. MJ146 TaxID=3129240 RepID=UPI0031BA9BAA
MARGITENDVHTAADALVTGGERPTVERIRAHLGTGSPNTIVRWLDTWWRGLGERIQEHEARLELPEAPEAVAVLAGKLWAAALDHAKGVAESSVASDREALDLEREAVRKDRESFSYEAEALRQDLVAAHRDRELAEARSDELERLVRKLEEQCQESARQRDVALERLSESDSQRQAVEVRIQALQDQAAAERESLMQHVRAAEDRAHVEIDRARQEARELKQRVSTLTSEQKTTEAARQKELEASRADTKDALRNAGAQRSRAEALETQVVHLRELSTALEKALDLARKTSVPKKVTKKASPKARKGAKVSKSPGGKGSAP